MSRTEFTEKEHEAIQGSKSAYHWLQFPAAAGGWWMIYHPWPFDHWSCQCFWVLFTGYVLLSLTSCLHETVHQTFCRSRWLNVVVGRLIGTMMLVPYTVYRESHIRHHGHLNRPTDWELWPYSDPKASLWFRHLFAWMDLVLGYFTTPYIYGRICFHKDSPIPRGSKLWRTMLYEYSAIVIAWASFLTALELSGKLGTKYSLWAVPFFVMAFLQTGRKFTEHLGMDSFDPLRGTRTVVGKNMLTRFCSFLQFDIFIHGPHHRHPKMAHTDLEAKMNDYLAQSSKSYPVYSRYVFAVWNMLPHLFRNPGCGVNAGGYLPQVVGSDPSNFVADVTHEMPSRRAA